jgi:hypothetical protein
MGCHVLPLLELEFYDEKNFSVTDGEKIFVRQ